MYIFIIIINKIDNMKNIKTTSGILLIILFVMTSCSDTDEVNLETQIKGWWKATHSSLVCDDPDRDFEINYADEICPEDTIEECFFLAIIFGEGYFTTDYTYSIPDLELFDSTNNTSEYTIDGNLMEIISGRTAVGFIRSTVEISIENGELTEVNTMNNPGCVKTVTYERF